MSTTPQSDALNGASAPPDTWHSHQVAEPSAEDAVQLDSLDNIYSYPGRAPVIVVYAATAIGGTLCVDDECLEAKEVATEAIPWDDLAFRSTHEGLRDYLDGSRLPLPAADAP